MSTRDRNRRSTQNLTHAAPRSHRARAKPGSHLRRTLGPPPRRAGPPRPSWKRTLQAILWAHNDRHATKPKAVSAKTQAERAAALFRCFNDLHALKFKIRNPYCLGGRHVRALVADWTAPQPRTRRATLSPATIQAELSSLRTFAEWIGKPGLVRPAEAYVTDTATVARRFVATTDRSWPARGIDPDALIEEIAAYDPWVGAELHVARAFGLRVKEAVMLQPRLAEKVPRPPSDAPGVPTAHLEVIRGTKGGRLRHVPIDTPAKRAALEAARALLTADAQYLANPARSLKQNLDRLHNVMKRFGVTRRALGVTAHGLRHGYAADRYEGLAGAPAPVRGGEAPDPRTDDRARLQVAEELGHSRTQILGAYVGGRKR
jgi:integrase